MSCILFVDDDFLTLEAYEKIFSLSGHEVLRADTGKVALEMVSNQKIDLIVIDMILAQDDGLEILETLKSNPSTCDIPVVMTSANPRFFTEKALSYGADYTICKPIDPKQIEEILGERGNLSGEG